MTKNPSPADVSHGAELPENLSERIVQRVLNARLVLEREVDGHRGKPAGLAADPRTLGEERETQSLKRVFHDLGLAYRRYRKQTGAPVVPEIRAAAYEFKANPSLPNLITVAAYLDRLDLLS